jgi:beta-lactamase regulating signal transducer with metallopeptidase domain
VNVDTQWLVLFLLKATVVLAAGMAAAAGLRRAPAGSRYLVWLATVAGVLALPALLRVAPIKLEVLPRAWVSAAGPDTPPVVARRPLAEPKAAPLVTEPVSTPSTAVSRGFSWPPPSTVLLVVWAAVAAALVGRLLLGALAARRLVRSGRPLEDPKWTGLLHEVADRLDLPEAPALVASGRVEMPFAGGAWRGTIVLPERAEEWPEDRRRAILFHELAHLRRRDLAGHLLGRLACAVYWFHPLVWTAARRLRAESERACDDLVLACGTRASDYASHLLDIVTSARGPGAPATAVPMARRREFEGRMLAILDPALKRRGPGRLQSAALLLGLAALFVSVALTAPASSARVTGQDPDVLEPPAAAAQATPAPRVEVRQRTLQRTVTNERNQEHQPQPRQEREVERERENEPQREQEASSAPTAQDRDRRSILIRVLRSDPAPDVRRSAAWALAQESQPDEAGVLIAALRDDADPSVREMAAWSLADNHGEHVTTALAHAVRKDASAEVRSTAVWALGQRGQGEEVEALVAAMADSSPEVRHTAIWALGQVGLQKAPPELLASLRDPSAQVRLVSAWALGEIQDPAALPALRSAFGKETEGEVRSAVFRALALSGDRSPEILNRMLSSKDAQLRARAILMLGGEDPGNWPWPWPQPRPRPMP